MKNIKNMKDTRFKIYVGFSLLIMLLLSNTSDGQKIIGTPFRQLTIPYQGSDTIQILENFDSTLVRPTLLFLQGSLPRPIVIDYDSLGFSFTLLSNFDPTHLVDSFNVVFVSHPYVPAIVSCKNIASNALFVPDKSQSNCFSLDYQKTNTLDYYVSRVQFAVNHLKQRYSFSKYFVIGHSQGAVVASKLCNMDSTIEKAVLLSLNPMGRYYTRGLYAKKRLDDGKISFDEYLNKKASIKEDIIHDLKNIDTLFCNGDLPKTKISYSYPIFDNLINSQAKLFLGIGELDINSYFVDLLEIYFIINNKTNYTYMIYQNVEHNFAPLLDSGRVDYKNSQWQVVIEDCIKWLLK